MARIIFPMITGGWIIFSSEYYYRRQRLWSSLNFRRKAEAGVRIYILLYQDPAGLGLSNYEAAKYLRRFTRGSNGTGNIFTLTHPDSNGPIMWVTLLKLLKPIETCSAGRCRSDLFWPINPLTTGMAHFWTTRYLAL